MNKYKLSYKKIFETIVRFEIEKILKFVDQVKRQNLSDSKQYEKEYSEIVNSELSEDLSGNFYRESIEDLFYDLKQINNLSEQLTIIALYKLTELQMKSVLNFFINDTKKTEGSFQIKVLKKIIKNNFGFSLSQVSSFKKIDELRLLNNSIKHQGTVSKALSNFGGWKEGDKIISLTKVIEEYVKAIPLYFTDLIEKIEKNKT